MNGWDMTDSRTRIKVGEDDLEDEGRRMKKIKILLPKDRGTTTTSAATLRTITTTPTTPMN